MESMNQEIINKSTQNLVKNLNDEDWNDDINNESSSSNKSCFRNVINCLKCWNEDESVYPIDEITKNDNKKILSKKVRTENELQMYFDLIKKDETFDLKHIDNLKKLVDRGADINFQNKYGDTLLLEACKLKDSNALEVFKKLRELQAKMIPNKYGHTVLHIAAYHDNIELFKYIVEEMVDEKELDGLLKAKTFEEDQVPLHFAAKKGSEKTVLYLIKELQVDIEAKDYQGRTPLYLACEHGQKKIITILLQFNADVNVGNYYGQKALFWIIAKCSDLAPEVLDQYRKCNKYTKRDIYYLKYVDLEPLGNKREKRVPEAKSILAYIVENQKLDLIIHPVITRLVKVKWKEFGRRYAYIDLIFTITNVVVWNIIGCLIPYNNRHIYTFPQDWWRIFLLGIGVLGMIILIIGEIREIQNYSKYNETVRQQRLRELAEDRRFCHPQYKDQKDFLIDEQNMCKKATILLDYFTDIWNWFDILSIILLAACVFTHIADIIAHSELLARAHIRIMSITVVFISIRLLKSGRVINEEFGMLVMTLYFVIWDVCVWIGAFVTFWIPYTSAFWMLYGDVQVLDNSTGIPSYAPITDMQSYNKLAFGLYRETFGVDVDREKMNEVDSTMTDFMIGSYLGITTLLMVNIFIALLTTTFNRVHESSKAYFILQRAIEILRIENTMNAKKHVKHLRSLQNDYVDSQYSVSSELESTEKLDPIKDSVKEISKKTDELNEYLNNLEKNMDESMQKLNAIPMPTKTNDLEKVKQELDDLKSLVIDFLRQNDNELQGNLLSSTNPQVDVLQLNDINNHQNYADPRTIKITPLENDFGPNGSDA